MAFPSQSVLKLSRLSILKAGVPGSAAVALAVFMLLGCVPPHGLDIAIERLFYVKGDFIWHNVPIFEFIHSYAKAITVLAFAGALYVVLKTRFYLKTPITRGASRKALYVILAMALCLMLTAALKKLTGMSCPWDLTLFGGIEHLSSPLIEFSRGNFSGKCWPSGFAGSAFCLYALGFILPTGKKRLLVFAAVTLLGLVFGLVQMGRGAHFLSHVAASGLLDYALCAILWRVYARLSPRSGL